VLNVLPSGEKNHFVTLFTREFGMIKAKAQSVRVLDSKLRYSLQEYSYIEVSLVKGKDIWRITNALPIYNIYFELKEDQNIFMVIARTFSLIRRLVPEEGCEALIFNDMEEICKNAQIKKYTKKSIEILEWLFVLRMLAFLGYSHKESFKNLCDDKIEWTNEYLETISSYKDNAINSINHALKASQL
jgi:DNA repair protein RecO (recombination protein O)